VWDSDPPPNRPPKVTAAQAARANRRVSWKFSPRAKPKPQRVGLGVNIRDLTTRELLAFIVSRNRYEALSDDEGPQEEPEVVTPSQSLMPYQLAKARKASSKTAINQAKRHLKAERIGKQRRATRKPVSSPTHLPPPLPFVSKEQAAAPVERKAQWEEEKSVVAYSPSSVVSDDDEARGARLAALGGSNRPPPFEPGPPGRRPAVIDTTPGGSGQFVVKWEKKGNSMLTNHEGRVLVVDFRWYTVPHLDDLGWVGAHGLPVERFHRYVERGHERVRLPVPLVAALGEFWAHKEFSVDEYLVSVEHAAALTRRIAFDTPEDAENAKLWGPVIGFALRAPDRSRATAVLSGKAISSKLISWSAFAVPLVALTGIPVAAAAPVAAPVALAAGALVSTVAVVTTIAGLLWWAGKGAMALARAKEDVLALTGSISPPHQVVRPRAEAAMVRVAYHDREDEYVREEALCTGFAITGYRPVVFTPNAWNEAMALRKRGMEGGPEPDPWALEEFCTFTEDHLEELYGPKPNLAMPVGERLALYNRQSVAECNSSPALKAAMLVRLQELEAAGKSCHSVFSQEEISYFNTSKMMVKRETTLKGNSASVDLDAKPRQIMCSDPTNTVLTMPAIKRAQGFLRSRWCEKNWLVYAPGADMDKVADQVLIKNPVCADNSDYGNYDATRPDPILQLFVMWLRWIGMPRGTCDIIAASGRVRGRSRWGWEFDFHELLGSGRAWTTLFNTWLNGTMRAFMYCRSTGQTIAEAKQVFTHVSAGDDGISLYDVEKQIDWAGEAARLGFLLEVERVREFHDYQFCAMRLFPTTRGLEWVDCPGRVIAKLGWSVRATSAVHARMIARGSALSFLPRCSAIPPLEEVLLAVERQTRGEEAVMPHSEPWRPRKLPGGKPTAATWHALYCVYGYTREMHHSLVGWLRDAQIGQEYDNPILRLLCDVDTGGQKRWIERHLLDSGEPVGFSAVIPGGRDPGDAPIVDDSMGLVGDWAGAYDLVCETETLWSDPPTGDDPAAQVLYDDPSVQVLVACPLWSGTQVFDVKVGTTVGDLYDLLRLRPHGSAIDVSVNGRPGLHSTVLDEGAAVMFRLKLKGGVRIQEVVAELTRRSRSRSNKGQGRKRAKTPKRAKSAKGSRKRRGKTVSGRGGTRLMAQQDVQGSVSSAPAPTNSVARPNTSRVGRKGGEARAFCDSGEDFWQNVPAGTYASGQVILVSPITISQMGSWLKTLLQLYEKWRITKLHMRFVTSVGSNTTGNVMMFFDPDPTNNWAAYVTGPDLLKRAFTMAGRVDFSLWQSATAVCPPGSWLWTQPQGSDVRLFSAGSFVMMAVTGFTAGVDIGAVYMDWSVEAVNKTYNQAAFTMTTVAMNATTSAAIFPGPASTTLGYALAPWAGGTPVIGDCNRSISLGIPCAVATGSEATGKVLRSASGGSFTMSGGQPLFALGSGEYLIHVVGDTHASVPSAVPANFTPVCTTAAFIQAVDSGATTSTTGFPNAVETTWIVEIPDDVHDVAHPMDANNDTSLATPTFVTPGLTPPTSDWCFMDVVTNTIGLAANIYNIMAEITEVVTPILGVLLGQPHTRPNVSRHLHNKRSTTFLYQTGKMKLLHHAAERTYMSLTASDEVLFTQFQKFRRMHSLAIVDDDERTLEEEEGPSPKAEKATVQVPRTPTASQSAPGSAKAGKRGVLVHGHYMV